MHHFNIYQLTQCGLFQIAQLFHECKQLELNVFVNHFKLHTKVNDQAKVEAQKKCNFETADTECNWQIFGLRFVGSWPLRWTKR
jgi:hypothetical protein